MEQRMTSLRDQVQHDEHYEYYLKQMAERRLRDIERRLQYLDEMLRVQKREE
jgi:hypothetical protein